MTTERFERILQPSRRARLGRADQPLDALLLNCSVDYSEFRFRFALGSLWSRTAVSDEETKLS